MIPITVVDITPEMERLVLEVLRSGQLAQGKYVEQFEQHFAELHGLRHAIAVNSGTTALVAALQALQLAPGDEVVTSPFTFIATVNAIIEAGATVRFGDIGDDFNLTPQSTEDAITDRTRVLMPVHLYGYMCDMAEFIELADRHNTAIVEDAAQAVGASAEGRSPGAAGMGCFSLYATKNLYTGEGGFVTTDDDALADRLRLLRNHGMRERYQYELAGHNYRLTNLAAAVGIPQLDTMEANNHRRQHNASVLRDGLSDIPGLIVPPEPAPGRTHVYHQFTVRITDDAHRPRAEFMDRLATLGVASGIYYPTAAFDYAPYRNHPQVITTEAPNTMRMCREVVSLPVHPLLSSGDLEHIIESCAKAMR